jgi:hypothetical protein
MKIKCLIINKNVQLYFFQVKFATYETLYQTPLAIQNLNLRVSAWCSTVIMAACLWAKSSVTPTAADLE